MNCDEYRSLHDLVRDAENGLALFPEKRANEYRAHRASCAGCRADDLFADSLEARVRSLPPIEAPRRAFAVPRSAPAWIAPVTAAAAAVLVLCVYGPARTIVAKSQVLLARHAIVATDEDRRFVLDRGDAEFHLAPDKEIVVSTPAAMIRARGAGFAVHVEPVADPTLPPIQEAASMNPTLKSALASAVVSVVVTAGTVTVLNHYGEKNADALQVARVEPGSAPEIAQMSESIAKFEKSIESMRRDMTNLSSRVAAQRAEIEKKIEASQANAGPARSESQPAKDDSPTARLERARKAIATLSKGGNLAAIAMSPETSRIADELRELGAEGLEIVLGGLGSKESKERFVAAALAEQLGDPALVRPLEKAAIEDEDFAVRRMSSHALAFMDKPECGDALVNVVKKEKSDVGVRLNAWYGVAKLKRPEAGDTFDIVFDHAGGEVSADMVIATGVNVAGAAIAPTLRRAYDDKRVTDGVRPSILGTLGADPNHAYDDFLRQVANDASSSEALRSAARKALER